VVKVTLHCQPPFRHRHGLGRFLELCTKCCSPVLDRIFLIVSESRDRSGVSIFKGTEVGLIYLAPPGFDFEQAFGYRNRARVEARAETCSSAQLLDLPGNRTDGDRNARQPSWSPVREVGRNRWRQCRGDGMLLTDSIITESERDDGLFCRDDPLLESLRGPRQGDSGGHYIEPLPFHRIEECKHGESIAPMNRSRTNPMGLHPTGHLAQAALRSSVSRAKVSPVMPSISGSLVFWRLRVGRAWMPFRTAILMGVPKLWYFSIMSVKVIVR